MDFTQGTVQINIEACRLNLRKAVRREGSSIGFEKTCIDCFFFFFLRPRAVWRGEFILYPL